MHEKKGLPVLRCPVGYIPIRRNPRRRVYLPQVQREEPKEETSWWEITVRFFDFLFVAGAMFSLAWFTLVLCGV